MKRLKRTTVLLLALAALAACKGKKAEEEIIEPRFLASERFEGYLYSINEETREVAVTDTIVRGTKLQAVPARHRKIGKTAYVCIKKNKKDYAWALKESLAEDSTKVILEKRVYARSASSIIADTSASAIVSLAAKGAALEVTGYDTYGADGRVLRYKVINTEPAPVDSTGKPVGPGTKKEGWIYSKYTVFDKEEALRNYMPEKYDSILRAVRNPFGGGKASGVDLYPHEKPVFGKRPGHRAMPRSCYSLYLNFSPAVVGNIDAYIALAKETKINTFVIDIKDNECPGYKADAMALYSPTNYARASKRGKALYERAVRRLHEEGFYVVGRITCFKDSYFVKDHPESAITDLTTGEPLYHNKSHWPSAYDRTCWTFNVELAKESVRRFGFDEINFDYVRFPDRMTKIEDHIDYHNKYDESKVQAIQRFVTYACDEIHAVGAYVSIDVFGECASPGYTTAYGQYWPALSNVADVMCGMPYPDHFADGFYGVRKPWNHPFEILSEWGKRVVGRQNETPTPAKVRTWVQAYHVMKYVDKEGIDYDAENVEKEIRGLFSVGLKDGYTTWLSSSNLERYTNQKAAFSIDYYAEY